MKPISEATLAMVAVKLEAQGETPEVIASILRTLRTYHIKANKKED